MIRTGHVTSQLPKRTNIQKKATNKKTQPEKEKEDKSNIIEAGAKKSIKKQTTKKASGTKATTKKLVAKKATTKKTPNVKK